MKNKKPKLLYKNWFVLVGVSLLSITDALDSPPQNDYITRQEVCFLRKCSMIPQATCIVEYWGLTKARTTVRITMIERLWSEPLLRVTE